MKTLVRSCLLLIPLWCVIAGTAAAATADVREGKEFVRRKAPTPVEPGSKIDVVEFFSYGGSHSNECEPFVAQWRQTLPADIEFHRVPVFFAARWLGLGKVYYTLEALGMERTLSRDVFSALHNEGLPLFREQAFLDWAARKGLDRAKVAGLYNSPMIADKVNDAKALAQAYNVQVVPMVIVDDKFVTDYERAGMPSRLPAVIDGLVVRARAERRRNLAEPKGR
jgi:thiol:disulfide interchange protein DsbA